MPDFPIDALKKEIEGEIYTSEPFLLMYATDASAYKEKPNAVIRPKNRNDIEKIIRFARQHKLPIIPRAAGTSLAGQVVGKGLVVDISRHLNRIIEINAEERWVRVEPGVVLDELNEVLKPYGLFFAPETSTSNRCMIGGMVGNNACGAHSLIYGSTRDHLLAVKGFLSDGNEVEFRQLSPEEMEQKCLLNTREGEVYRKIRTILSDPENRSNILKEYPDPSLKRRNTGYAIDILLRQQPFSPEGSPLNLASLIAGSEGTLMFLTEITLHLEPLPPPVTGLVAVHCHTLEEALQANLMALSYSPGSI
ncbi:MAG TPA: FAD-binding oxidoreductase [Bacteroidales bacterium]|nr:FAD-binding oxidoreductase [Bacteroidales bacterium]